jgi:hypothetical protein
MCVLPEDGSTEPKHAENEKNIFQQRIIHKKCCIDGIYNDLQEWRFVLSVVKPSSY